MTRTIAGVLGLLVAASALVSAQTSGAPRNDLPQPYRTTRDWGQLPPGVKWAAVTAVEPAPDGSIYVIHRCFANSCAGRTEAPILKYDARRQAAHDAGAQGMFVFPHGATVDRDGNLWVTDARGEAGKGHQVFKFSPDGKVLMTLGKAGVSGSGPDLFDQPTDVVVAPERRHLRHRQPPQRQEQPRRAVHARTARSSRSGARRARAPARSASRTRSRMDSRGRLFVGDRENNRIQIFDQDGNVPRRVAAVRPPERHHHHRATTPST